jgi:hypothetical protein
MTNTNSFLPQDYEVPSSGGHYFKPSPGENKIRILSKPVIGWVGWDFNNKVQRFAIKNKPEKPIGKDPIQHFWAFIIWNYAINAIQIYEVTQQTIQQALKDLSANDEWGAPFAYDVTIKKEGVDKKTKYTVMPSPKKKISDDIHKAALEKPINLEALFTGADPFQVTDKQTTIETDDLPF